MGMCMGCIKFLMIAINLLIFLLGLCIVTITTWILLEPGRTLTTDGEVNFFYGVQVLLVVGIVILIIGLLGFFGAYKESQCLLVSFFTILLVVTVAQVTVGMWIYYNSQGLDSLINDSVKTTIQRQYDVSKSITTSFDAIQIGLQCCGASNSKDWQNSEFNKANKSKIILTVTNLIPVYNIPQSCCVSGITEEDCRTGTKISSLAYMSNNINPEGCMEKVVNFLKMDQNQLILILCIITAIELIILVFSFIICFSFNRNSHYNYNYNESKS